MAPVVHALAASDVLQPHVVVTGQHREMLDQVLQLFAISPEHDLNVITPRQSLTAVTTAVLAGLEPVLNELAPDVMVVQGDTTTSLAAALAGHYARIPVAHLEAGLRTFDRWTPFPEEMNRRLTSQLSSLHLAPTASARANLVAENVPPHSIHVTGNTVIDALLWVVGRHPEYRDRELEHLDASGRRVVLVTAHRRESWGEPMVRIATALARLAAAHPAVTFVVPMHRNPTVRDALVPALSGLANVLLTEPLDYGPFARLMARAHLLLTDSGGVQEEGPSLGKPVLVMRDATERPEAIAAGTARLVGTGEETIVQAVTELLEDEQAYAAIAHAVNPYGDGKAAWRCERALATFLGLTDQPLDEFVPEPPRLPGPRREAILERDQP